MTTELRQFNDPVGPADASNFSTLLGLTIERLAGLSNAAGQKLFAEVSAYVKDPKMLRTPCCCCWPRNDAEDDNGISNAGCLIEYEFDVGVAVRDYKDALAAATMLDLRKSIKDAFPRGFRYESVPGHCETTITRKPIPEPDISKPGLLLFGTGLTIVFSVQE